MTKIIINANVAVNNEMLTREYKDMTFDTFGIVIDSEVSESNKKLVERALNGEVFDILSELKFRSANIYIYPEE